LWFAGIGRQVSSICRNHWSMSPLQAANRVETEVLLSHSLLLLLIFFLRV
jgi:hypothetical protein